MSKIDNKSALEFIKEDFILTTTNIQKTENKLHLILALSLTVGAAGFGFLGEQAVSEKVINNERSIETLQIGFFVLAILQWLIALSYIGYFYNLFIQIKYVDYLSHGLRQKLSDKKLRKYFIMCDSYAKKINLQFPNILIMIFSWGVPIIVPSLLGLFAIITGYNYGEITCDNFDLWFMYSTANFFGILLGIISAIILIQVIRRKLF